MLMGQEDRFSVDVDVAGPYSTVSERMFEEAAKRVGLPVNPPDDFSGDHIEWIGPLRLCLAPPAANVLTLWQGSRLSVFTLPLPDLIASKLIRYDPTDQGDIQFIVSQQRVSFEEVEGAVDRLPNPFREDALVRENLRNLCSDMLRWNV